MEDANCGCVFVGGTGPVGRVRDVDRATMPALAPMALGMNDSDAIASRAEQPDL